MDEDLKTLLVSMAIYSGNNWIVSNNTFMYALYKTRAIYMIDQPYTSCPPDNIQFQGASANHT